MNRPIEASIGRPKKRLLAPECLVERKGSCDEFERLAPQVSTHIFSPGKNGQSDPVRVQERTQLEY